MDIGYISGKTFGFINGHHRGRSGSGWYRYGFQFKRCVCLGKIQRLLLFSQTPGCLVPSGNRGSARGQKHGLPQIAPAYLPHHAGDFSAFACCYVSGNQQGGPGSAKMANPMGVFISTLRAGKVYPRSFYRQISGQKSRQAEELRLRLPSEPDRLGFLFRSNFISTRFWHRHNYLPGHLHNAFCRRSKKKVSVSFRTCVDSLYSIGNPECRIPNPKNYRFSRSLARPFKCRVSSHPVFLRFWPGRILGNRIGSQPSKTFLSSRSPHGFYFFRHRGRTGVFGNNGDYSPVFNIDLEGFRHRLPSQRPVWNSFGNRLDSFDRVSGFYQPGSDRRASSNQGINPTLHQHGWVINVNHHAFSRRSAEYFGANGKTSIMIECENELS